MNRKTFKPTSEFTKRESKQPIQTNNPTNRLFFIIILYFASHSKSVKYTMYGAKKLDAIVGIKTAGVVNAENTPTVSLLLYCSNRILGIAEIKADNKTAMQSGKHNFNKRYAS